MARRRERGELDGAAGGAAASRTRKRGRAAQARGRRERAATYWLAMTQVKVTSRMREERALMRGGLPNLIMV